MNLTALFGFQVTKNIGNTFCGLHLVVSVIILPLNVPLNVLATISPIQDVWEQGLKTHRQVINCKNLKSSTGIDQAHMTQHSHCRKDNEPAGAFWPRAGRKEVVEGTGQPSRGLERRDHLCLSLISTCGFQRASRHLFYIIRWNTWRERKTRTVRRSIRDERKYWNCIVTAWSNGTNWSYFWESQHWTPSAAWSQQLTL